MIFTQLSWARTGCTNHWSRSQKKGHAHAPTHLSHPGTTPQKWRTLHAILPSEHALSWKTHRSAMRTATTMQQHGVSTKPCKKGMLRGEKKRTYPLAAGQKGEEHDAANKQQQDGQVESWGKDDWQAGNRVCVSRMIRVKYACNNLSGIPGHWTSFLRCVCVHFFFSALFFAYVQICVYVYFHHDSSLTAFGQSAFPVSFSFICNCT